MQQTMSPIPLLGPRTWLGDDHLQLVISHIKAVLQPKCTMLIAPCMIEAALEHWINWQGAFEHESEKAQVVLFVNNETVQQVDGGLHGNGSHWTILTLCRETGRACHWDSFTPSSPQTISKVRTVYESVTSFLSKEGWQYWSEIQHANVFPQSNGYDCGVHAWMHAVKFICGKEKLCWPFETNSACKLRAELMSYIKTINTAIAHRKRVIANR